MRAVPPPVWNQGIEPKNMSSAACQQVLTLFLNETGERYSDTTVRHLPIPNWEGNLILIDTTPNGESHIVGLLWATPFMDDIVRVAAFVIHSEQQKKGLGTEAWNRFVDAALSAGYKQVQLEVKANNVGAQRFYERRGMTVRKHLEGYYQSGMGYMMRGPLLRYIDE